MIKYYCDKYKKELNKLKRRGGYFDRSRVGTEIRIGISRFNLEVMVSRDGVSNSGELCQYCIIEAIAKLDDRKKKYGD